MRLAVDMHEKAVKVFEDESKRTDGNDNLRKFAADTLPKLRDHLKKAREVANTVK
jgi:predicted outer membrane protein